MTPRVAVIDVGSNSIKALVAESTGKAYGLRAIFEETLEVRISHGIGGEPPMLRPERIEAGLAAIDQLWKGCQQNGPLKETRIVATSAVRSAANGHLFMNEVEAITGVRPETLSGAEEAEGIACGVRTDPAVEETLNTFTVFDLGGGSLELIRFEDHQVRDRISLPLGSVRMTERFISNSAIPIPLSERAAISKEVKEQILAAGINLCFPLVGCSGSLSAMRHVSARIDGISFTHTSRSSHAHSFRR